MNTRPMRAAEALDQADPDVDDLRADLDSIRTALDRLIAKAGTAGMSKRRRFGRYLETLDRMHAEVTEALDNVDDEESGVDEIAEGVREAWARLAIAKTAAAARFH